MRLLALSMAVRAVEIDLLLQYIPDRTVLLYVLGDVLSDLVAQFHCSFGHAFPSDLVCVT